MQADYNVIGDILAKYPDLTQDEESRLKEWRATDENEKIFQELTNSENRHKMLERYYEIIDNEEPYLKKINELIAAAPVQNIRRIRRLPGWTYMAAASALIAVAAYLVVIKKHTTTTNNKVQPIAVTSDVAPGKYKAKLKLADGSVVYLDSASNQIIGQQGNIAVKNKDGQLIYDVKNPSSTGGAQGEVLYNTLSTGKGETYATILSDGSKVWLNSASSIHYPVSFSGNERRVNITGEAYFEVAKDASKPFIVSVSGTEVRVLGTHFDINAYGDDSQIKTTLLEGSVKVTPPANDKPGILKPGEQAKITGEGHLQIVNDADLEKETAWRSHLFIFKGDNLVAVANQLSRWYNVDVVYQGNIPDVKCYGIIDMNMSASNALKLLELSNVHFKIENGKIIVIP